MASGKKQLMVEENGTAELVQSVWELYGWKIVAKRVNLIREMECLMVVGLWCAHPDPKSRPSMKQAISALNFEFQKDIFLLWDAQTMQLSDFTTRFVFDIRPQAQTNFTGDGLAFFLSVPVPTYSPTLSMPTYSFTSDAQVNSINGSGCEATGRICSVTNGMLDGCGVIGEKWNARWSWGYGTLIPDPEALPSMEQAISVLNFEAPSPELPPAIFEYSNEF
ncbi:hypothetical protein ZIOFF_025722 [Zingiber officinale]|uniref:Legume lectin domain-containing protein n=1 Tax=Zingiber officinale TaxID=94328 RepID=A0A8J5HFQ0_ZINOF|nr:hypothetical protein ZIOFF_025722 [Zingiber officinale]